jgi:hypothetical protein
MYVWYVYPMPHGKICIHISFWYTVPKAKARPTSSVDFTSQQFVDTAPNVFNHRASAHVKLSFQSAIPHRPDRIIFTYPRTASCPLLHSARHTPSILFASSRIAPWCRTGIARHLQIGDLHGPQTHNLDTTAFPTTNISTKRPYAQQGSALHI